MPKSYTSKQLAQLADVSRRTIHFYVKEGLLLPPEGRGRNARYGEAHYLRLVLIGLIKASTHLRLEGIREFIEPLTTEQLRREIRRFEGPVSESGAHMHELGVTTGGDVDHDDLLRQALDLRGALEGEGGVMHFMVPEMRRRSAEQSPLWTETGGASDAGARGDADTWHRVRITDALEIHYRAGCDRGFLKKIGKLIVRARKTFRD